MNKQYGKNGIKNFLNTALVKLLWERDGASNMKRPTIDRIDTYGHYSFDNCRFLEWEENNARPHARYVFKNPAGITKCKQTGKWRVQIGKKGKVVWGGRFTELSDAMLKKNELQIKLLSTTKED